MRDMTNAVNSSDGNPKRSSAAVESPEPVANHPSGRTDPVSHGEPIESNHGLGQRVDPIARYLSMPSHAQRIPRYMFHWVKWSLAWAALAAVSCIYAQRAFGRHDNTFLGIGLLYLMLSAAVWSWYGWNLTAVKVGFRDSPAIGFAVGNRHHWRLFDRVIAVAFFVCCAAFAVELLNVRHSTSVGLFALNAFSLLVLIWWVGRLTRRVRSKVIRVVVFTIISGPVILAIRTENLWQQVFLMQLSLVLLLCIWVVVHSVSESRRQAFGIREEQLEELKNKSRKKRNVSFVCAAISMLLFGLVGLGANGKYTDVEAFLTTGCLVVFFFVWFARESERLRRIKASLPKGEDRTVGGSPLRWSAGITVFGFVFALAFGHLAELGQNYYDQKDWAERYESQESVYAVALVDYVDVRKQNPTTFEQYFRQCDDLLAVSEHWENAVSGKAALWNEAESLRGLSASERKVIANRKAATEITIRNAALLKDEVTYCNQMRELPPEEQMSFYNAKIVPIIDGYHKLDYDSVSSQHGQQKAFLKSPFLVEVFRSFHPSFYDVFK